MCTICDMAHDKSVVKLLANGLEHVSGNIIQCGSDSLLELINASRKRGDTYPHERKSHRDKSTISSENCLHLLYAWSISLADSHWDKLVLTSSIKYKILICFYTFCENLRLFQQELPKLLTWKLASNFQGHPVFHSLCFSLHCFDNFYYNFNVICGLKAWQMCIWLRLFRVLRELKNLELFGFMKWTAK